MQVETHACCWHHNQNPSGRLLQKLIETLSQSRQKGEESRFQEKEDGGRERG